MEAADWEIDMKRCKFWAAVLIAVLLLPTVAVSAGEAKEALENGNGCMDKKDFDAAIAAFTEAIRFDPKNADACFGRGVAYGCKGEYGEADCRLRRGHPTQSSICLYSDSGCRDLLATLLDSKRTAGQSLF